MATIPSAEYAVPERPLEPDLRGVQYPRLIGRPGAVGDAYERLGAEVNRIGTQDVDAEKQSQIADAQASLLTKKVRLENQAMASPQWQTAGDDYSSGMSDAVGQLSPTIDDPRARASFAKWAALQQADGLSRVSNYALGRQRATDQETLGDKVQSMMDAGLASPSNSASIINGTNALYDAAVAKGTIGGEEASRAKRAFAETYSTNLLLQMPAWQRAQMIKGGSGGTLPGGTGSQLAAVSSAIGGQEWSGEGPAPTSVDGAVGPSQILPATASQYGLDPSKLNDPDYAAFAKNTIISKLAALPNVQGDPARIAVGYFSGAGNISPAGSEQPFLVDKADSNGKTTSSYVADVQKRMAEAGAPEGQPGHDTGFPLKTGTFVDFIPMAKREEIYRQSLNEAQEDRGAAIPQAIVGTPGQPGAQSVDDIRLHYAANIQRARDIAEQQYPGDAQYADRAATRTATYMDAQIHQQELAVKVDKDTLWQAVNGDLTNGHLPISIQEMTAISPKVAQAWDNVGSQDPYHANMIESRLMAANAKGAASGYGTQFYSHLQSVLAPTSDPTYVHDAGHLLPYVGSGPGAPLTNTGFSQLQGLLALRGTPQGEATAAQLRSFFQKTHQDISLSDPANGVIDHKGEGQFGKFTVDALNAFQAGQKAGIPTAQMFDPKSPNYIGATLHNFTRSTPEMLKDLISEQITPEELHQRAGAAFGAVDSGLKSGQFNPSQANAIKGVALLYHGGRITRDQAKAWLGKIDPSLAQQ